MKDCKKIMDEDENLENGFQYDDWLLESPIRRAQKDKFGEA